MRPQRGAYRSLFSVLFDDPDYQRLPSPARLVLVTARCCREAGPMAIFRYYLETLASQVGLPPRQVRGALVELARHHWIEYDAAVLWVRNGLRYEPTFSLADPKHRKAIDRRLEELPHSRIVLSFCNYYNIACPFEGPTEGPSIPLRSTETDTDTDTDTDTETEKETTHGILSDAQFLASLKSNPAYQGINLDLELAKMDAWLLTPRGRRRKKTHQFVVNWLNNVDQPLAANGHSPFDARTQENIRAGQAVLDRLKERPS